MNPPDHRPAPSGRSLPRRLSTWTATAAVVGVIVGSGILRVPTTVASLVDSPAAIIGLWIAGGLFTITQALVLAELGALFPSAGGMYVFMRQGFGERMAFVYGWTFLLVNPAAWATLATLAAEYLGPLLGVGDGHRRLIAMALIVGFAVANSYSTVLGAALQNMATAAKLTALAALTGLIVAFAPGGQGAFAHPGIGQPLAVSGILAAFVAVLWTYSGAAGFCALAGEVRDPQRAVPRALIGGVGLAMALFLTVNIALLYVMTVPEIAGTPLAMSEAVGRVVGPIGGTAMAVTVVIAALGSLGGIVLSDPRVFFAMAQEGHLFAKVGAVQRVSLTPVYAIALHAGLGCLYASSRTFDQLAATFVLGFMPFYALAAVAVWRLRRTRPDLARPFVAPAAAWLAVLWVVVSAALVVDALIETPEVAVLNVLISLSGLPVFALWRRWSTPAQR